MTQQCHARNVYTKKEGHRVINDLYLVKTHHFCFQDLRNTTNCARKGDALPKNISTDRAVQRSFCLAGWRSWFGMVGTFNCSQSLSAPLPLHPLYLGRMLTNSWFGGTIRSRCSSCRLSSGLLCWHKQLWWSDPYYGTATEMPQVTAKWRCP